MRFLEGEAFGTSRDGLGKPSSPFWSRNHSVNQAQGPLGRMVPSDHGESLWGHGADGACLSEQLRKVWRAI